MSSVRYHINPETGNANKCQAKTAQGCKFSKNGTVEVMHFDTKEVAQKSYEITMEAEGIDIDAVDERMSKLLNPKTARENNIISYMYDNVFRDENDWTANEKENFLITEKVAKILDKDHVSEKDFEKVNELISMLRPKKKRYKRSGWSSNDPVYRDEYLTEIPKVMSIRKQWEQETHELRIPRDRSDLQEVFHNPDELNKAHRNFIEDNSVYGETNFGDEKYVDDALNRVAAGDKLTLKADQYDDLDMDFSWETALMNSDQKVFALVSKDEDGRLYNQKAYLALAFPENELKDALKEAGVKNVKIDSFTNGREVGNIYTVYQPDGNTRSFSVYEHRNSDSIIINGSTNWSKESEELPYASNHKNGFFAEISYSDTKRAAGTLAYFMKEAQKGELEDDATLVNKAERLDWNAILREQLPGFKEWSDKQGFKKNNLSEDDPRNES